MSQGSRFLFDHAKLERGEFYSAYLRTACFFDCDLSGADGSQAVLPGARFHGSDLSEIKGGEYLRCVVFDSSQVLPLATRVLPDRTFASKTTGTLLPRSRAALVSGFTSKGSDPPAS